MPTVERVRSTPIRRYLLGPMAKPLTALAARVGITPMQMTIISFLLGIASAISFVFGYLLLGALLYFAYSVSDSMDGRLNRLLGRDDTFRGMLDFTLDGLGCIAVVVALALYAKQQDVAWVRVPLIVWMCLHYLDMRFTSAIYRLKVQYADPSIWIVREEAKGMLGWYAHFLAKHKTYPHPTIAEATQCIFVLGPTLWYLTHNVVYQTAAIVAGILCTLPEIVGAAFIVYRMAKGERI